ncbi:NADH dehydrogenase [ubiquinone] 1 beta subcomplex subunit 6-like [Lytechinus pictus]|uniref:NADH dehydrogenase [ubiquinone] 1 beta subcomplex subunit 6-like n=1 Tax=Lytechinus pictus TaxID=7653 RepID=UPI00240CE4F5|nr:NADH dehydrogenase [ubiquinone] 1 beta subcomplex subunit 6-like [Lytechinus pictus]
MRMSHWLSCKMANPIRSLSRPDKRPPAGSKPALPEWAKGDYVLEKWVGEERQRRRNWLRDQELHPSEPRPEWRPQNPFLERLRAPFRQLLNPIDKLTGHRLRSVLWKGGFYFKWFVLPVWVTHYVVKYHLATKPGYIVTAKRAEFPENPLHSEGGGHH